MHRFCAGPDQPLIAMIGNIGFVHDGVTLYVRVMVPGRRDVHVVRDAGKRREQLNAYERARYAKRKLAEASS